MVGRSLGQVWAAWRIELQFLSTRVTQPGEENGLRGNDCDRAVGAEGTPRGHTQRAHPEGTPTVSVWLEEAGMRGR